MRRALATLLAGCVLVLAGWAAASPASACSCAATTPDAQLAAADVVFTGMLVSRTVERPPGGVSSSVDPALHVFAVDAVQKGTAAADQVVVSADSGASCGLELAGDGPFLVFATQAGDGVLRADLCGGTAPLTPELAAQVAGLDGTLAPPAELIGSGPLDPAMAADGAPRSTALALETGAAVLALLAGVLVVRSRRRARRTTIVVLTRD